MFKRIASPVVLALVAGCNVARCTCDGLLPKDYLSQQELEGRVNLALMDRSDSKMAESVYHHYLRHSDDRSRAVFWMLFSAACGADSVREVAMHQIRCHPGFARRASDAIRNICYNEYEASIGMCDIATRMCEAIEEEREGMPPEDLIGRLETSVGCKSLFGVCPGQLFRLSKQSLRDLSWRAICQMETSAVIRVHGHYAYFADDDARALLWHIIMHAVQNDDGKCECRDRTMSCSDVKLMREFSPREDESEIYMAQIRDTILKCVAGGNQPSFTSVVDKVRDLIRQNMLARLENIGMANQKCGTILE